MHHQIKLTSSSDGKWLIVDKKREEMTDRGGTHHTKISTKEHRARDENEAAVIVKECLGLI